MANQNLTTEEILRKFLNPALKGKFSSALLAALAAGDAFNDFNILAVKDQLFLATATGQYLDKLLSRIGIVRPPQTGIDDDTLRNLAVSVTNNKLVSNIFLQILEAFYGIDAVRANVLSSVAETYALADGMQLIIEVDDNPKLLTITFNASDFSNIAAATALEVANAISRSAFSQGYTLLAIDFFDNISDNTYVQLFSGTRGPRSSITVKGGQAQNILRFPTIDSTTQNVGTQFTLSVSGGNVRYTWTAGADPGLGVVEVGDYVNIFGVGFNSNNRGTFDVKVINSGTLGNSYFEIENPNFTPQAPVNLGTVSDVLFFNPTRITINNLTRRASVYEVNPYEIVILLPVTTKIVKRQLIGSAHLNPSVPGSLFKGPYIFDPAAGVTISNIQTNLSQDVSSGQVYSIVNVNNAKSFPDNEGFLMFEFGYSQQEGPVRYLGRSSNTTLLLDPAYKFKKTHLSNTNISFISNPAPPVIKADGTDYPFYLTDSVQGRIQAQNLIQSLTASGIAVSIILVVPEGPGLFNINDDYGV